MRPLSRRTLFALPLVAPLAVPAVDLVQAAARDRLIKAGVVTGREPSHLDVVARYRGKRALLGYLLDGKGA